MNSGIVFDIQRASMNDGPGIRTTVFLKGCPLRCQWCHNPESWKLEPEEVISSGDGKPKTYGRNMTVAEVMTEVVKDVDYYRVSGGGLTVSGGEPTVQFEFCLELLTETKKAGIQTCLDTSGFFSSEKLEELFPVVDVYHYDYKATGSVRHRELIGVGEDQILRNLTEICRRSRPVILRCPLIPGVNDEDDHLEAIARWSQHPAVFMIDALPYHTTGNHKWTEIGRSYGLAHLKTAEESQMDYWKKRMRSFGCKNLHFSGQRVEG